MRTTKRAVLAVVAASFALTACGGDDSGTDAAPSTEGAVVVHALDSLKFDQKSYTAKAGTVTIDYVSDGSLPHTLLIDGKSDFDKLVVNKKGERDTGSAVLQPGTYTIYCDVAGHRAGGMEAKLVVT